MPTQYQSYHNSDGKIADLIDDYILAWNSRGTSFCTTNLTASRQINEMIRNELNSNTIKETDFVQEISILHQHIKILLGSEMEGHEGYKSHLCLAPEHQKVLIKMRKRELLRRDKMEARHWIQHINVVRRNQA